MNDNIVSADVHADLQTEYDQLKEEHEAWKKQAIHNAFKTMQEAKEKLVELLDELGTDECYCDEPSPWTHIFFGNEPEMIERCLNCGGVITK